MAIRKSLALAAVLAASALSAAPLVAPGVAVAQAWRTHVDGKYSFRVDFPGVPSLSQQTSPAGNVLDVASLEAGTTGAFIVVATANATPLDAAVALEKGMEGAVAGAGGELISKKDIVVDGAPGRDIVIRSSSVLIRSRMVVQGPRFIQVLAVGPADADLPGADRFLNSFRLGTSNAPVAAPVAKAPEAAPGEKTAPDAALAEKTPAEKAPAAKAAASKTPAKKAPEPKAKAKAKAKAKSKD